MDSDSEPGSEAEVTVSQADNAEARLNPPMEKATKKKKKKRKPTPPVLAKVQVIREHPEKISPIIAYFPSGFDPSDNPGAEFEDGTGGTSVEVYRNKLRAKRLKLVVSPTGSNVEFVGSSHSSENEAAAQRCLYSLGVFDKASQTLKVLPVACNKIFRLEPKVKGVDFSKQEPATPVKEELSTVNKYDKMNQLTDLYGTKKSIKEVKKRHALNQGYDPESQKDLEGKISSIALNKEATERANSIDHISRNVPPYNDVAETPREAYPLDKIILKAEWNYVEEIFDRLQQGVDVDFMGYPTFVCNRIDKLQQIQDEEERKKLCRIYSYINHLIKYKDQHSMDGHTSSKGHRIPSMLQNRFSAVFPPTDSKRLPPEKINLLISYILVLSLHADEFRTDYSDMAKDLRMGLMTLKEHYAHLGCKFSFKSSTSYATLPVPLKFPQSRQRRRR